MEKPNYYTECSFFCFLTTMGCIFPMSSSLVCYQCSSKAGEGFVRPKCEDFWRWSAWDRKRFNYSCPALHGNFCTKRVVSLKGVLKTDRGCHSQRLDNGLLLSEGCYQINTPIDGNYLWCLCSSNNCNSTSHIKPQVAQLFITQWSFIMLINILKR